MDKSLSNIELSPEVRPLFWDVDLTSLDTEKHADFVISRILCMGRPEHVRWVLENYPKETLRDVIRNSTRLDRKTANFWALYYNIPREEIRCFRKS